MLPSTLTTSYAYFSHTRNMNELVIYLHSDPELGLGPQSTGSMF